MSLKFPILFLRFHDAGGHAPNAIVFGTGYLTIPQMVKAGFAIVLMSTALITVFTFLVIRPLLGV